MFSVVLAVSGSVESHSGCHGVREHGVAALSWRREKRGGGATCDSPSGGAREEALRDSLQHRQHNTTRPSLVSSQPGQVTLSSALRPRPSLFQLPRLARTLAFLESLLHDRSPLSRRVRSSRCHVQTSRRVYRSSTSEL